MLKLRWLWKRLHRQQRLSRLFAKARALLRDGLDEHLKFTRAIREGRLDDAERHLKNHGRKAHQARRISRIAV